MDNNVTKIDAGLGLAALAAAPITAGVGGYYVGKHFKHPVLGVFGGLAVLLAFCYVNTVPVHNGLVPEWKWVWLGRFRKAQQQPIKQPIKL